MTIETLSIPTHEKVVRVTDAATGLIAYIAIHDTTMGPALGGCRYWEYASEKEALDDALRLSRGMTFKNILAGLPHGGGKAVILANPKLPKSPQLFRAFGQAMNQLGGEYTTGEDVGVTVQDMEYVRQTTPYVAGLEHGPAASGNPAPFTAWGVVAGMRAATHFRFGSTRFDGMEIAIQGLGQVGFSLCEKLHRFGARLTVADIDDRRVREAQEKFGARASTPDRILTEPVDIASPCALGGVLHIGMVETVRAPIIAGSANNQLGDDMVGTALWKRGILYAPDYVVNAGGVINVAAEASGHYDECSVMRRIARVETVLLDLFARAEHENRSPHLVADEMAMERLATANGFRPAA